jgi:hypothetical protein
MGQWNNAKLNESNLGLEVATPPMDSTFCKLEQIKSMSDKESIDMQPIFKITPNSLK